MPEPKTGRRKAAKKKSPARKPPSTGGARDAPKSAQRTTDLSEELLKELEDGASSSLDAVRKFLVAVDEALPPGGEGRSRREDITDSALEMTQRLLHTQAEFLRKVIDTAGKSMNNSGKAK
jgi:hypothetical protein